MCTLPVARYVSTWSRQGGLPLEAPQGGGGHFRLYNAVSVTIFEGTVPNRLSGIELHFSRVGACLGGTPPGCAPQLDTSRPGADTGVKASRENWEKLGKNGENWGKLGGIGENWENVRTNR